MNLGHIDPKSNLWAENRLMKVGFIVLLITTCINSVEIRQARKEARTHWMPITAYGDMWVTSDSASDDYLIAMAKLTTHLLSDINAGTVDGNFDTLLKLIDPSRHADFQEILKSAADELKKYPNVGYSLEWNATIPVEIKGNTMIIAVQRKKNVGRSITSVDPLKYELDFDIRGGRFWINDIREMKNAEVHTQSN